MRGSFWLALALWLASSPAGLHAQPARYTVMPVAGADAVRDGEPAVRAILHFANSLAFHPDGRLFIADTNAQRIRVVTPDPAMVTPAFLAYTQGAIATFAGVGAYAYSGDGGPAGEAHIASPQCVAVDPQGNVYFSGVGRVRKVDSAGTIRTVAGGGLQRDDVDGKPATDAVLISPYGLAFDRQGNLYVSENTTGGRVFRISPDGLLFTVAGLGGLGFEADGGPARDARLLQPMGLALDAQGNLYVAERGRYCIRKVTPDGTISTVAGNGRPGSGGDGGPAIGANFFLPASVLVDANGTLLILDAQNATIRAVGADGIIRQLVGPGSVTSPAYGLAMDPKGNLWITRPNSIEIVDQGRTQYVLGESGMVRREGAAREAMVLSPFGLAMDGDGLLYFSDLNYAAATVKVIDPRGWLTVFTSNPLTPDLGDGKPFDQARIANPRALAVDSEGNLFLGDLYRIRRVSRADTVITTVAGNGQSGFTGDGGPALEARIDYTDWIALDSSNQLFISSLVSSRVRKVDAEGRIMTVAGNGTRGSSGDGGPATEAALVPRGIAVDREGALYIADTFARRIRRVAPDGVITSIAGGGTKTGDGPALEIDIPSPNAVAVTPEGDVLFSTAAAIYRVSRLGWLERLAGGDLPGYSGDGGPALESKVNYPATLWADRNGVIYFADTGNHRIRKLVPAW